MWNLASETPVPKDEGEYLVLAGGFYAIATTSHFGDKTVMYIDDRRVENDEWAEITHWTVPLAKPEGLE